jgi:hypothetical protein
MTDCPREEILALVAAYGPDVLDMSRTVESELHLHCPDQPDEVSDFLRLLQHGKMAGGYRNRGSASFLRTGFFHGGTESVILRGDHVPRRLRLPG